MRLYIARWGGGATALLYSEEELRLYSTRTARGQGFVMAVVTDQGSRGLSTGSGHLYGGGTSIFSHSRGRGQR